MLQLLAGTDAGKGLVRFERHRSEQTLLYKLVEQYYPDFEMQWASEGRALPDYVRQEFDEYLKCGRLEYGFLRVQCETCHAEHLVAFSCKRRGFCPSCGARRMAESAALLVDEVLLRKPMRQLAPGMACSRVMQEQLPRLLSVPFPPRFLFASQPKIMGSISHPYSTLSSGCADGFTFQPSTHRETPLNLVHPAGTGRGHKFDRL